MIADAWRTRYIKGRPERRASFQSPRTRRTGGAAPSHNDPPPVGAPRDPAAGIRRQRLRPERNATLQEPAATLQLVHHVYVHGFGPSVPDESAIAPPK